LRLINSMQRGGGKEKKRKSTLVPGQGREGGGEEANLESDVSKRRRGREKRGTQRSYSTGKGPLGGGEGLYTNCHFLGGGRIEFASYCGQEGRKRGGETWLTN